MKIQETGHTKIITDAIDLTQLIDALGNLYDSFKFHNLIVDLSGRELKAKELSMFSDLARQHKKNKKSLVIVASGIDFTAVPARINAVPTIGEAHDLIEMEEIERDLGF